jgi:hypothetical protein
MPSRVSVPSLVEAGPGSIEFQRQVSVESRRAQRQSRPRSPAAVYSLAGAALLAMTGLAPGIGRATAAQGKPAGHVLRGFGIQMPLPHGWDGRIYLRARAGALPVLQAANFRLPRADGDSGSRAARRMKTGSVRIVLWQVAGVFPGLHGRPSVGADNILRRPPEGFPNTHAVAKRTFSVGSRGFILWVDFGRPPVTSRMFRLANSVLMNLRISPGS